MIGSPSTSVQTIGRVTGVASVVETLALAAHDITGVTETETTAGASGDQGAVGDRELETVRATEIGVRRVADIRRGTRYPAVERLSSDLVMQGVFLWVAASQSERQGGILGEGDAAGIGFGPIIHGRNFERDGGHLVAVMRPSLAVNWMESVPL